MKEVDMDQIIENEQTKKENLITIEFDAFFEGTDADSIAQFIQLVTFCKEQEITMTLIDVVNGNPVCRCVGSYHAIEELEFQFGLDIEEDAF